MSDQSFKNMLFKQKKHFVARQTRLVVVVLTISHYTPPHLPSPPRWKIKIM